MSIQPFTIAIPQATLDDLRARLAHTRWPNQPPDIGMQAYRTVVAKQSQAIDAYNGELWKLPTGATAFAAFPDLCPK